MAGVWEYYQFNFNTESASSGQAGALSTTESFNVAPWISYKWNAVSSDWLQRGVADATVDTSDADIIMLSYDTSTGTGFTSNSDAMDLKVSSIPVSQATTGQLGGMPNGSSSGDFYYTQATIVSGIRGQTSVSPGPSAVKLRVDNNGSTSGNLVAFLGIRRAL